MVLSVILTYTRILKDGLEEPVCSSNLYPGKMEFNLDHTPSSSEEVGDLVETAFNQYTELAGIEIPPDLCINYTGVVETDSSWN